MELEPNLFDILKEESKEVRQPPQIFPPYNENSPGTYIVGRVIVDFKDGTEHVETFKLLKGFWLKAGRIYGAPFCLEKCVCPKRYKRCTKSADLKTFVSVVELSTGKVVDRVDIRKVNKVHE